MIRRPKGRNQPNGFSNPRVVCELPASSFNAEEFVGLIYWHPSEQAYSASQQSPVKRGTMRRSRMYGTPSHQVSREAEFHRPGIPCPASRSPEERIVYIYRGEGGSGEGGGPSGLSQRQATTQNAKYRSSQAQVPSLPRLGPCSLLIC